jgi:2-keto-3-deoxy-L-rhamnonate aldolase RhmA
MGIPAQFEHPRFLECMDRLVAECQSRGIAAGFLPPSPESAARWIRKGFRAISLASDIGMFVQAVKTFQSRVRDELGGGKA